MHYESRKYRKLINWIAGNDNPVDVDIDTISTNMTVCMVADCYNLTPFAVASDVLEKRKEIFPS